MRLTFEKFCGASTIVASALSFLYAVSFIIISRNNPGLGQLLSADFLLLLGIFSIPTVVAVSHRLKEINPGFADLAFVFGIFAAAGAVVHGGFDLANTINPPSFDLGAANLPSQVDPRGLLTFGFLAVFLFIFAWMNQKSRQFPASLAVIGAFSALLLITIYLGRLTVLDPTNPIILYPVLLNGFVVYPVWLLWTGYLLASGKTK